MLQSKVSALALGVLILLSGCAKKYVVTTELITPIAPPIGCTTGAIVDELPASMAEGQKPTAEDVAKLKRYIEEEVAQKGLARFLPPGDPNVAYEVSGSFLEFKRGSGIVRFFIGFGLGSANATIGLRLVDTRSGAVLFAGNFTGNVSSWAEGGDTMFRRIAGDFAKELAKQLKKLDPDAEIEEAKEARGIL
jgi:hypothetical protein